MKTILALDDHELILAGTVDVLHKHFPEVQIITSQTADEARAILAKLQPDLVLMDLSFPQKRGMPARTDTGIDFIKMSLELYPEINILVQSIYIQSLVRIRADIDNHRGGFVIADKAISSQEMIQRVTLALQGFTHTKDLKGIPGLKPEWVSVLALAFREGLQDKAIAERLAVTEATIRHYWNKIQDALGVYQQSGINLRIQTEIKAREYGLID